MDILNQIKKKLQKVSDPDRPKGINAVLAHIEIAERYYEKGISEKDDNYFTDVVYRTNHAFEGILKEAYETIEEKDSSRTTPFEIENYLSENSVFNERVMHLFSNYRKNWRNPSTHDYQLFFANQEAFLAIVTVSSFINILLDQIIEKLSFKTQKEKVLQSVLKWKEDLENYDSLSIMGKSVEILKCYAEYYKENFESLAELPEAELLGSITGYFSAFEPRLNIETNKSIKIGRRKVQIDIVLSAGKEELIVEIKRNKTLDYSMHYESTNPILEQLQSLMSASNIERGIAFYTPSQKGDEIISSYKSGNQEIMQVIYFVQPDMIPSKEYIEAMESEYSDYE